MNVWIIADVARSVPGGMRRHMELHAEGLRRLGQRAETFFAEDFEGSRAERVPRRLPGVKSWVALRERLRQDPPDVVNVHTQCAPAWIVAARARRLPAKVVVMSYAADEGGIEVRRPRDVLRWDRAALPARATFPFADGIWSVNRTDLGYYRDRYGVHRDRLACIPHAVGDEFYANEEAVVRQPQQVLFAGTWIERKGVDVLAAALALALQKLPDLRVVLAGTVVEESVVRRALPPELAERARILSIASDPELRQLYRESSLLVLPSRREGLPIVMLEAMACGCPSLAAANSGMLDVIEPGVNGWLEPSFAPERWGERVVSLLADPAGLARASAGAAATAQAFRIETVARTAFDWYQGLARRGSSDG
ncbi:MAG TPA: glycosyltransferase family 4 protein [Polyangiaceae bacterium]|nr:glycosyltransferase family 4 protein [Polyangiaceae bacterium]